MCASLDALYHATDCNTSPKDSLLQVVTLEDEVIVWKQLLPALAERCELLIHFEGIPVSVDMRGVSSVDAGTEKILDRSLKPRPDWTTLTLTKDKVSQVSIPLFSSFSHT